MNKEPEMMLAPSALEMIVDYLKKQPESVRASEAEVLIESACLTVDMLEDSRRIELNCSNPDFDYIQQMNELLDILSP